MSDRWQHVRDDIKAKRHTRVSWRMTAIPGTVAVELLHDDLPMPIATLWARHVHTTEIEILYVHTLSMVQRCGAANWLLQDMISWWPDVTKIASTDGSDSGRPWMKANGFRKTKNQGWIKRLRPRKAKK